MSYIPSELKLTNDTINLSLNLVDEIAVLETTNETGSITITTTTTDSANEILLTSPNIHLQTDSLLISDINNGVSYSLPLTTQPTDNSIIVFSANGSSSFQPNGGGGGAVNAILNSVYPAVPATGTVLIMNGDNAVSSQPSDAIQVQSSGTVQIGNIDSSVLLNIGNGGSSYLKIADDNHIIGVDDADLNIYSINGTCGMTAGNGAVSLKANQGSVRLQSRDGVVVRNFDASKETTIQQEDSGNFTITNNNLDSYINLNTPTGILMTIPGGPVSITDTDKQINIGCAKGRGYIEMRDDTADLYINTSTFNNANQMLLRSPNINLQANTLTIEGESALSSYQLPIAQPTANTIIQFQANGTSAFIPTPIASPDAFINTQPNTIPSVGSVLIADGDNATNSHPSSVVKVNATGLTIGDTAQITNAGSYMYTAFSGGNIVCNSQNGGMVWQTRDPIIIQNNQTYTYTSMLQGPTGNFSLINENFEGIFEFKAPTGSIAFTTGLGTGCSFNGVGSINNSGNDLAIGNGSGNLILSSKNNDVVVSTEGGGKFQVNQGSLFQGDVVIGKDDPKLSFESSTFPTQQAYIEFNPADELIIKHHSPDVAAITDLRLGVNDITMTTNFQSGNINMITGAGHVYINSYTLPSDQPQNNQIMQFQADGTSAFIDIPAPSIPQNTYTYWVSNQGNNSNNGTIINPFQTIAYALTVANTLAQTDKVIINCMAGTYTELNLTISKNNLTINGASAVPGQTIIEAVITYAIDNTSGALIASSLYGLTVRGVVYAGSSTADGSYVLGACILGTLQDAIVPVVNSYNLAGLRDITMSNCVVYAWNVQCLTTVAGRINCTATLFTQSGLLLNNAYPLIECTGNALISLFGCQCYSLNSTDQAPPIIRLANTIAPSSTYTFNSCTIQYVFATVNVAPLNKVCIGCTNTVGISMYAYNNLMIGEGTRITNSGAQYVIISKQGSGSVSITYGNNLCGATASHYPTAAVRTQLVTATN